MEKAIPFVNGFFSWYSTGLDDLLLLGGILVLARSNKRTMAVFMGQLVAVLVVLGATNLLVHAIQALAISPAILNIISGGILATVGVVLFRSADNKDQKGPSDVRKSWLLTALGASIVYWLNSTDDISVVSGMFLPLTLGSRLVFSVGFLAGWTTSFVLAYQGSRISNSRLNKLLAALLILWGLVTLGTGLFGIL